MNKKNQKIWLDMKLEEQEMWVFTREDGTEEEWIPIMVETLKDTIRERVSNSIYISFKEIAEKEKYYWDNLDRFEVRSVFDED